MPQEFEIHTTLVDPATDRTSAVVLRVRRWESRERSGKAVSALLACWAAAAGAVFIPLLHFVLVPGLLLGGLLAFYLVGQMEGRIVGGEGRCPACEAPFAVAGATFRLPQSDLCTRCRRSLRINAPLRPEEPGLDGDRRENSP